MFTVSRICHNMFPRKGIHTVGKGALSLNESWIAKGNCPQQIWVIIPSDKQRTKIKWLRVGNKAELLGALLDYIAC